MRGCLEICGSVCGAAFVHGAAFIDPQISREACIESGVSLA